MDVERYISTNYLGRAGELRVASELMLKGYNVFFGEVDDGIDLVIDNGKRIQIKTARKHKLEKPYPHTCYGFNFLSTPSWRRNQKDERIGIKTRNPRAPAHTLSNVDIIIMWAVDDNEYYIIPVDKVRGRRGITFTGDYDKRTQLKWNRWLPYRNNWDVLEGILPEIPNKKEYKCQQCGYGWEALIIKPTRCPQCHARYYIKRERLFVDGKVTPLTQAEKNDINKTECVRVRWANELGKTIEEIEKHEEIVCKQCGYKWIPIKDNPDICPHCHGYWQIDRKREIVDGEIVPRTKEELRVISSQNSNKRWGKDLDRNIDESKVKELYEQGYSCPKIAKQLGWSPVKIWQIVKKLGIIRSKSEGIKLSWSDRKINNKQLETVL